MLIHRVAGRLVWPAEHLPATPVDRDWHDAPVAPPATFALACDDERLWLLAGRGAPPTLLPDAEPGTFVAGLWRCDVAELFLGRAGDDRYLELNVAPNGAWWSCEFAASRVRRCAHDVPLPGVVTYAAPGAGGWRAALGVPLAALGERGVDDRTTANVTFVVDAPAPRYLTAAPPVAGAPDFHAPALRRPVRVVASG